ncbi:uncharacterized protein LOC116415962 [Nasonia vitripennis]|uniref:Uncharacterized protein n=1 Tax=Nasonia vitripennis TaxID=7425 RepID=A0A7M7Q0P6_NASVI|nr:uncharacterized protein LOC116415962 [Nasonia vitripennis]
MESIYDEIMTPHNTPGKCVALILKAMIGAKTLSKCTRTSRESNRKVGNMKRLNDSDTEIESDEKSAYKPEKLDKTKLAICFDLYVHWLKNHHSKINTKMDLFEEMANFNSHVSKSISYLKRPAQKRKIQKNDDSSSDNEVEAPTKIKISAEVHADPTK